MTCFIETITRESSDDRFSLAHDLAAQTLSYDYMVHDQVGMHALEHVHAYRAHACRAHVHSVTSITDTVNGNHILCNYKSADEWCPNAALRHD